MKWLRPWIPYLEEEGLIGCCVCTFQREVKISDGGTENYIATRKCANRSQVMRFFKQHQHCAPHAW